MMTSTPCSMASLNTTEMADLTEKILNLVKEHDLSTHIPSIRSILAVTNIADPTQIWERMESAVNDLMKPLQNDMVKIEDRIAKLACAYPDLPRPYTPDEDMWCKEKEAIFKNFSATHEQLTKYLSFLEGIKDLKAQHSATTDNNGNRNCSPPESASVCRPPTPLSFDRCPNCNCNGYCLNGDIGSIKASKDQIDLNRLFGFNNGHRGDKTPCPTCGCTGCHESLVNIRDDVLEFRKPLSKPVDEAHHHRTIQSDVQERSKGSLTGNIDQSRPRLSNSRSSARESQTLTEKQVCYNPMLRLGKTPAGWGTETRMITISNFPGHLELRDVLAKVRVGRVVWCTITDAKIPGGTTAVVVAETSTGARGYAEWAQENGIFLLDREGKLFRDADVTLIPTPTYPWSNRINDLLGKGVTRCLRVEGINKSAVIELLGALGWFDYGNDVLRNSRRIVDAWIDGEAVTHLQFSNLDAADLAFQRIRWDVRFEPFRSGTRFEQDPCAGSVYELWQDTPRASNSIRGQMPSPVDLLKELEQESWERVCAQSWAVPLASAWDNPSSDWAETQSLIQGNGYPAASPVDEWESSTTSIYDTATWESSPRRPRAPSPLPWIGGPGRVPRCHSTDTIKSNNSTASTIKVAKNVRLKAPCSSEHTEALDAYGTIENPGDEWHRRFARATGTTEPRSGPRIKHRRIPSPIRDRMTFGEILELPDESWDWTDVDWWKSPFAQRVPVCSRPTYRS